MRPLKIYVETSVFGFCFDKRVFNRTKREVTLKMFDQISSGKLEGYISEVTLAELLNTTDSKLRESVLNLTWGLKRVSTEDFKSLNKLTEAYIRNKAIPRDKRDDAIHIALMVLNPFLEVMVSWNCTHLANENNKRFLEAITLKEGFSFNFTIVTPEEVIVYER